MSLLERIDEEMDRALRRAPLPGQLRLAALDDESWEAVAVPLIDALLGGHPLHSLEDLHGEAAAKRAHEIGVAVGRPLVHRYGFYDEARLVGVFRGRPSEGAAYHMSLTALSPEWRRRGVYQIFLGALLEAAQASGFLTVESRHHADNNPVLIAKLKAGFTIRGLVIDERMGLMVDLVHDFSDRARAARHRLVTGGVTS